MLFRSEDALADKLLAISQSKTDTVIFLRGDQVLNYGRFSDVLTVITKAGFSKITLVSTPPQGGKK